MLEVCDIKSFTILQGTSQLQYVLCVMQDCSELCQMLISIYTVHNQGLPLNESVFLLHDIQYMLYI